MVADHEHAEKTCHHHDERKFKAENIFVACAEMGVHQQIQQKHTDSEPKRVVKSRAAEIFTRGDLAETSEGNGNGDRRRTRPRFAEVKLAPIDDKMKYQRTGNNRCKIDIFDKYVERVVALDRHTAHQQKRQKRGYQVVTNNENEAKEHAEKDVAVNDRHITSLVPDYYENGGDKALNYHKGFGQRKPPYFFDKGVLLHFVTQTCFRRNPPILKEITKVLSLYHTMYKISTE